MIPLTISEVAHAVGGRPVGLAPDVVIQRVVTDSREVDSTSPTLFVARRGEAADGHEFAEAAVRAGATAVLAERELDGLPVVVVPDSGTALVALARHVRDRVAPTVVAITGSVGKTTTKDLIGAACAAAGPTVTAVGSFNNEVGVPLTVLSLEPDTRTLVTEMGARGPGQIAELAAWVRPDIGVVTAVAGVHLELFGDIEAVAAAKGELPAAVPPDGTVVLNVDDDRVAAMRTRTAARVLGCSAGGTAAADLRARDVQLDRLARPAFVAETPWGAVDVRLPIAGRHHVGNALFALAASGAAGVPVEVAAAALGEATISSWRGEVTELDGAVLLNDAYNANPTSTIAALDTLDVMEFVKRRIAVLGVMAEIGADHEVEHRRIGAYAAGVLDLLIVVGDAAAGLAAGARDAGLPPDAVIQVSDAAAAVRAVGALEPGDALLVKGSRVAGLDAVAAALVESSGPTEERAP
jgi:UDP-N-acetylmuramoyl-tripeptide--D-alanyl-D-alanine ligase